jgi:tRNA(Ile)-lysidine synthase
MCLLHLLHNFRFSVIAAHLDHKIRATSGDDAIFVHNYCQSNKIPYILQELNVKKYCKEKKLSIEEGARNQRYGFLFDSAKEYKAQGVLIAHHSEDQVETILMHFLRGAGLSGLKGMKEITFLTQFSKTIPLIRPLLVFSRRQIENYCEENHIPFVTDQTNTDTTIFRNKLRHDLIPLLEEYNPRFKEVILRGSMSLYADFDFINEMVVSELENIIVLQHSSHVILDLDAIRGMSTGFRWNALRRVLKILRNDIRDFDFDTICRLDEFLLQESTKRLELAGGLEARKTSGNLMICDSDYESPVIEYPQSTEEVYLTAFPLDIKMANNWVLAVLETSYEEVNKQKIYFGKPYDIYIDSESVRGQLILRNPNPGDRIQPLGLDGHHAKISDIFINRGIPIEARLAYPLICDSERIVWIPGVTISEWCKVTENTKKILHLKMIKVQEN